MIPEDNQTSSQSVEPTGVTPTPPASFDPPAFHNPLATGYQQHANLPPLTPPPPPETPPMQPSPAPTTQPSIAEVQAAQPIHPENPITPAPVRLAPEPRANIAHGQDHEAAATGQPYRGVPTPIPSAGLPALPPLQAPAASKPVRKGRLLLFGALGILLVAVLTYSIYWYGQSKRQGVTPSASPSTKSTTRNTAEPALIAGAARLSTDCYQIQLPSGYDVRSNKDCLLDAVYGPQKTASITISTFKEFDLVLTDDQNKSQSVGRFDSRKVLDALIKNATDGRSVASRETIKVGGLEAEKIVARGESQTAETAAYVFIVLPETDQQFAEKKFIAFIATGVYNDDYSRKGFDQALSTWTWK